MGAVELVLGVGHKHLLTPTPMCWTCRTLLEATQSQAWPHPGIQSIFINRCSSPASKVCDFVCDCRDCSDENQCGYHKESVMLGTPFTCDFEEGNCGWKDVSTSAYRWVTDRASIAMWGTGPSADHTRGTDLGWYMAAEMRRNTFAAIARLRSPVMQQAAATCEIRAWYRLWETGPNETVQPALWVELTYDNETRTLWQSLKSSISAWQELVAYTGRVPGEFQITLSSRHSSLQLDDVEFRSCGLPPPLSLVCGPDERNCSRGSCVQLEQLCDGTDDCGDLSDESATECGSFTICSFEMGWCGWNTVPNYPTWIRNTSLHLVPGARSPTRDHSSNSRTGFFLYVSTGPQDRRSDAARLVSPTFQATTTSCCSLVFYSHLYDSATSSLNIYYKPSSGVMQLVRSRAGDLGDYWFREKVDFSVTESFQLVVSLQIILEGMIGTGPKGSMALDDLVLSPGCVRVAGSQVITPQTSSMDPTTPCTPQEFACNNTKCISAELACDFIQTCEDGSDETYCAKAKVPELLTPAAYPPVPMAVGTGGCSSRRLQARSIWGSWHRLARGFGAQTRLVKTWCVPGASTFEAGARGWKDVSVGQLQWARQKASEALLPGADHTTNTSTGSYLGVVLAPGQVVSVARARTPVLGPSGLACSVEMHYWLHSDPQGFIALGIVDHALGTHRLAWQTQGNGSTAWKHISIPLGERARPFQLELTALVKLRGPVVQSAAVDDVVFVNCDPRFTPPDASELSCNFEMGLCGWYQDQSDDFEWARGTGLGLGSDHTTGTGYFLSVDLSAQSTWDLSARLVTYPQDPPSREQCLSFWYRLDGPQSGTLNLKIQHDGEPETVLWTQTGSRGSTWHLGFATLSRQALQRYRLIFEALRDGYLGNMALDDVTVRAGACGPQTSCSFEANSCGFSSSWQYTWARQSNATGTATVGPPTDHTMGTARGYYMIVDTSKAFLPRGQAATLSSGQYRPLTGPQCLGFWYQLSPSDPGEPGSPTPLSPSGWQECGSLDPGTNPTASYLCPGASSHEHCQCLGLVVPLLPALCSSGWPSGDVTCLWLLLGSLMVFMKEKGVQRRLFSVSSAQGDAWRYGKVTVQAAEDWQAVFEVVSAGGELSYVALDDLHLKAGSCPEPGSCDFESDTCGWTSPSDRTLGSYAWGWRSGASLGPKVDHTLGTTAGHYVYFDASVLGPGGNAAWLLSEHLPATMGACLRFWYHMDFPEHFYSGELRVKLYSMAGELTVWCARGHQGHGWRNRTISVQNTVEFQIVFEVANGMWPAGGTIALDDITYHAGEGCDGNGLGQMEGGKLAKGAVAAVVIGIFLATVFLLLLAWSMCCWLKRRVAAGRMPEERAASQGFDNITFRDDRVTITPLPADEEAEPDVSLS
ncbi:apical endosomal glycoprotein [Gopherus evgoodei]|uniref:apical endosomal glycoprotein n=1 Tax=Gopherus evgoodei TaxID=1825980 RepID=UPI0011CF10C6|nr:apical endosomal glycoprotein [Gopherus evgoodei]